MIGTLELSEHIRVDHIRMTELRVRLGACGAGDLVARSKKELAVQLALIHTAHQGGHLRQMQFASEKVQTVSDHIGMITLAGVAASVCQLSHGLDGAALSAATARLLRIGEQSLVAVLGAQDMSV